MGGSKVRKGGEADDPNPKVTSGRLKKCFWLEN